MILRNVMDLKQIIRESVREHLKLNEVSDEQLSLINNNDRVHISEDNKIELYDTTSKLSDSRSKPIGFWYGFGNSWIKWVKNEMPEWDYNNVFKIQINDSKILQINTYEELYDFTMKYKSKKQIYDYKIDWIDWIKVSKEYNGIEINPYQYRAREKSRSELSWYYGWDVASGCIWNPNSITKIEKI